MTQNEKRTATPRLRFPEFRNDPPWPETPLNVVLFEHGEKNDGKSEVHSVSVHKGVVNQVEHLGRSFAAADRSKYNLAKPHDIIYTKSPTGDFPYGIVKQNQLPYNVIVSPLYGVFSPINRHLGYLLDAYFESPFRTNAYLAPIIQKGAKNTIQISNARFLSKGLYLPQSEAEHKKIAECLSTLDELIEAESRKLDTLKAHKKGLMQQLFPREGETRPRLRFSEFRNAPAWTSKELRSIAEPVSERAKEDDANHILTLSAEHGLVLQSEYFGKQVAGTNAERYFKIRRNDFVYNDRTTKASEYGTIKRLTKHPHGVVSPIYKCFRFRNEESPGFWEYYFESGAHEWELHKLANEGARAGRFNVTIERFLSTRVFSPETTSGEQQKIAECLSTLDELIEAESRKLDTLKAHKQGLLQQLFPSPSAIES